MKLSKIIKQHRFLFAAITLSALAAMPLMAESGLLNTRGGGDSPFLLQRLHQLTTALANGRFPVRWMPDANYGYGYPFYNFYAPLSIYITAVFRTINFSFTRSIQLSQLTGFIVAGWGMYALAGRWFKNKWAALLAAAAYTTAPFHLVNIYVRGDSLAEFWAMAFYPLVILAVDGVMGKKIINKQKEQRSSSNFFITLVSSWFSHWERENSIHIALLALAYAALILSHNISALIFSPFLLLYIILHPSPSRSPAPLLALLLAFALTAWFFVPAMVEKTAVQLSTVTEGYFHFSNHFRTTDLLQTTFLFDYNPDGGTAFRMGLLQFLTIVAGAVTLLWNSRRVSKVVKPAVAVSISTTSARTIFILLTLVISTFMILPISTPLWEHLPLLSFTQFPWRFLSVQAFAGAMAVGALGLLPRPRFVMPTLILLLFLTAFGTLQTDHLIITDADVTAVKLAQYEWFTGNIGSTVSAEYLPLGVQPRPYTSAWLNRGERNAAVVLSGDAEISMVHRKAMGQKWRITAVTPATIQFPTLNWLGWKATIDGKSTPITSAANGLITLNLPTGTHDIELRLHRTPIQAAAEIFSLIALLLTGWLLRPPKKWAGWQYTIPVLAALATVMLILRLRSPSPIADDNLTWDFAQMGYLHHDVNGVLFDNGATLLSYTYLSAQKDDNRARILLEWADVPAEETMVTATLSTPATAWPAFEPSSPPLLIQSQPMAGQMIFHFDAPVNMPASLYLPQLDVKNASPLTPSGQKRGDLYLRPFTTSFSEVMADGKRPLSVRATAVSQNTDSITVNLAWLTNQSLAVNYNTSLRLVDANEQNVSQWDGQPGYGFQPSSLWQPGVWMPDQLSMPSPAPSSQPPYALVARLYDVTKTGDLLIRRLGEIDEKGSFTPHEPSFNLPDGIDNLYKNVVFYEDGKPLIQLHGANVETITDTQLVVRLYWEMLAETDCADIVECVVSYTRFVHLSPDGEPPIAQNDGLPVHNSYPTSQWQIGEIVIDEVVLPVMDGKYNITTGFYQNIGDNSPRLQMKDGDAFLIDANR